MKKSIIILLSIIIIILLCSCSQTSKSDSYTKYNGAYYKLHTSNGDFYESTWYPLSNDYHTQTGYYYEKNDFNNKYINKNYSYDIKAFTDNSLSMFVKQDTFWGESLYGQVDYDFPNYLSDNVEEIVIKTSDCDWVDCYNNKNKKSITSPIQVSSFMQEVRKVSENSPSNNSFEISCALSGNEVGLKFKGISAIYYLGMIDKDNDGNYYLYNANTESKESVCYKINANCLDNIY